uniref:Uncharacterized protein n=1 Tax=Anopheles atroparvus TaxID=41427 RepID=A0A182IKB0_ANOAO
MLLLLLLLRGIGGVKVPIAGRLRLVMAAGIVLMMVMVGCFGLAGAGTGACGRRLHLQNLLAVAGQQEVRRGATGRRGPPGFLLVFGPRKLAIGMLHFQAPSQRDEPPCRAVPLIFASNGCHTQPAVRGRSVCRTETGANDKTAIVLMMMACFCVIGWKNPGNQL